MVIEVRRFKTKEEFIRDGQWYSILNIPLGWGTLDKTRELIGKPIYPLVLGDIVGTGGARVSLNNTVLEIETKAAINIWF